MIETFLLKTPNFSCPLEDTPSEETGRKERKERKGKEGRNTIERLLQDSQLTMTNDLLMATSMQTMKCMSSFAAISSGLK